MEVQEDIDTEPLYHLFMYSFGSPFFWDQSKLLCNTRETGDIHCLTSDARNPDLEILISPIKGCSLA